MTWENENRRKKHKKRGNQRVIYFTSDLHLGHRGIITMQNRPFKTVEEMNRILIQNFNACVGKGDTVYILGDICHHMPVEAANDTISSLHGHIHADSNYNWRNKEQGIKRYDVGVDANNFVPISIKQILQFYSTDN